MWLILIGSGLSTLLTGCLLAGKLMRRLTGFDKVLVFAPAVEAGALTIFAAEHFVFVQTLRGIVPPWLHGATFWTLFVGVCLFAAAASFMLRIAVQWSALLFALLCVTFIATLHLPALAQHLHQHLYWTITARESAFAGGALVLSQTAAGGPRPGWHVSPPLVAG